MRLVSRTLAVLALLAVSGYAATNDIELAVLRFPKIEAPKFHPDVAAACANTLIRAGREAACGHLRELAEKRWESIDQQETINQNICLLCRLAFANRTLSDSLRAPRLGALGGVPYESMSPEAWPYLPFAISNDVPLSMNLGYLVAGVPERASNYLAYCASNGVFRTNPYAIPTPAAASNALHQVLSSSAWNTLKWKDSGLGWSYSLDESYARKMLWKQVQNVAN